jgi:hypothetical protein
MILALRFDGRDEHIPAGFQSRIPARAGKPRMLNSRGRASGGVGGGRRGGATTANTGRTRRRWRLFTRDSVAVRRDGEISPSRWGRR